MGGWLGKMCDLCLKKLTSVNALRMIIDNIWWESTTNIDGVNFKNKKYIFLPPKKKKKKIQNYMCVKCNYFKAVFGNM